MKILIFGDSIVWGAFDLEKGGWAERLKEKILETTSKTMSPKDFYPYNFGMESDDSETLLYRFKKQIDICERLEPNREYILLFAIGTNDSAISNGKSETSTNKFLENIKLLITQAKKVTDNIWFIGLTNVDESKTCPVFFDKRLSWKNKNIEEYNLIIEKICKEEMVNFISLWNLLTKEDLFDGLHPNAEGHRKIFERVKDKLKELENLK